MVYLRDSEDLVLKVRLHVFNARKITNRIVAPRLRVVIKELNTKKKTKKKQQANRVSECG